MTNRSLSIERTALFKKYSNNIIIKIFHLIKESIKQGGFLKKENKFLGENLK